MVDLSYFSGRNCVSFSAENILEDPTGEYNDTKTVTCKLTFKLPQGGDNYTTQCQKDGGWSREESCESRIWDIQGLSINNVITKGDMGAVSVIPIMINDALTSMKNALK